MLSSHSAGISLLYKIFNRSVNMVTSASSANFLPFPVLMIMLLLYHQHAITIPLSNNILITLYHPLHLKGTFPGLRQNLATESPLKMMKNAFYFTSEALFVLNILNFCLDIWSCRKTAWLEARLISKLITSQPG